MAGVTGPMLQERRRDGVVFLAGFVLASIAAGLLVSLMAYLVGSVAVAIAAVEARELTLVAVLGLLAAADLLGRTPHVWRQVPQSLVRILPPGQLGVVWGFDIGLQFTTQKVVSLGWASLAAVVLLEPATAPLLMLTMTGVTALAIAAWSVRDARRTEPAACTPARPAMRSIRTTSGAALVAVCVITTAQVL